MEDKKRKFEATVELISLQEKKTVLENKANEFLKTKYEKQWRQLCGSSRAQAPPEILVIYYTHVYTYICNEIAVRAPPRDFSKSAPLMRNSQQI